MDPKHMLKNDWFWGRFGATLRGRKRPQSSNGKASQHLNPSKPFSFRPLLRNRLSLPLGRPKWHSRLAFRPVCKVTGSKTHRKRPLLQSLFTSHFAAEWLQVSSEHAFRPRVKAFQRGFRKRWILRYLSDLPLNCFKSAFYIGFCMFSFNVRFRSCNLLCFVVPFCFACVFCSIQVSIPKLLSISFSLAASLTFQSA